MGKKLRDSDCMSNLGSLYECCFVHYAKAKEYYEMAIKENNNVYALINLAAMYQNGRYMPVNINKSIELLEMAYSFGRGFGVSGLGPHRQTDLRWIKRTDADGDGATGD